MSSSKAEPKQHQNSLSIFDLPSNFFDSCRLFSSSCSTSSTEFELVETAINGESLKEEGEEDKNKKVDVFIPSWSCHTCNAEFDSLQEQRSHFKSDFHRLNVKLKIAGKSSIKEEDFDESASDSLFRDNDISSISGSEDENERASFPIGDSFKKAGESNKQKVVIRLHNGELVSFWKCLLLKESENISYDNDKLVSEENNGFFYLREKELVERLKSLTLEPRDKSKLRIVLLASGGHFAACVFDGNSVVAHKTFHRYVVRAKAGKKQSSKDASGNAASSAGASLRRHNELALKKEIQELMAAWKPYLDASTCVFISAPSKNKQLLYDAEKAYFSGAVRHIPFTVRRPTLKEAKRIYGYMTNVNYEVVEKRSESILNADLLLAPSEVGPDHLECNEGKMEDNQPSTETAEECQIHEDSERTESELLKTSTLLHEAAKSGNAEQTLELLAQGLDPCIIDERGRTPYMLATDKEVRNTFRRFMALNLDKWDWHTAKVPSPLTKEMEESQAAKQ
ncbi:Ankyrin repeat and zinc finger domain-containing protein, partial [Thalictrum thalictroides]